MKYLIFLFPLLFGANTALADQTIIAVSANFLSPVKAIVKAFEKSTGHKAIISVGSTGQIYSQIINGAPYDVFLSADKRRPEMLENDRLIVKGSRFTYAIGKLALYSSREKYVDVNGKILNSERFSRIAMADPKIAPYGLATKETLVKLGLYKSLRSKMVQGISVSQAFQFVYSGSVELGFVALSQIKGLKAYGGSYWVVPEDMHSPIEQQAVLLKKGRMNRVATGFVEFLQGNEAKKIIDNFGYITP